MEDLLLEARKSYDSHFKQKHQEETDKYFEKLVADSKINVEENRKTIKERNDTLSKADNLSKRIKSLKTKKTLFIVLMVALLLIGLMLIGGEGSTFTIGIILCILDVALSIFLIIQIKKKINPEIKDVTHQKNKLLDKAEELLALAYKQLAPLNILFDWNIPSELFTKTVPVIEMDKYFDRKKFMHLSEKYGFKENDDVNRSTVLVQSGSIYGNPFIFYTDRATKMVKERYSNSIVISWTTTRTVNGKTEVEHHSQTLTAEYYADKPVYFNQSYLVYGNEAAPDLCFSRAGAIRYKGENEDKRAKIVRKNEDDLEKLERDATTKGLSFTRLGNDEFETFFGGTDRNNEVQYRLLFTPYAQLNMLDLIYNDPYGDDFEFKKVKELNYIRSEHSQNGYNSSPSQFIGYDIDEMKSRFKDINERYFKGVYFDFAPLMSVPLYLQNKAEEYIYKKEYKSNIVSYEHEVMANSYKNARFAHPDSVTEAILKSSSVVKRKDGDIVNIKAHSYEAIERVKYFEKLGGDGKLHTIPVYWYEYLPLEKDNMVFVSTLDINQTEYMKNDSNENDEVEYQRGLISLLCFDDDKIDEKINGLLEKFKKGE